MDTQDQMPDRLTGWEYLLLLIRSPASPSSSHTSRLASERAQQAHRSPLIEQIVAATSWDDLVHFQFGYPDDEGDVPDGEATNWCAIQTKRPEGWLFRIDVPDDASRDDIELLAGIARGRREDSIEIRRGSLLLHYGDEDLSLLAADAAVAIAALDGLGEDDRIDGTIWESSEQPDGYPSLGDLSSATSMYG